ncbi:DUF6499 domain-containing protein [Phenylobacterium sp.]|uniref:transcriptional regulator domain-containing protein n=1 Tax=Phenylobacterium sp. TaxID=1871053 RepID=UPI0025FF3F73|nr:DUF6499 domain-containing protein [Phenylobacterium sp.]
MGPDTSNWRNQDSYDFYDELSVEGIAWECLRRDLDYQARFADIVTQKAVRAPFEEEAQHRWGLRFSGRSKALHSRPACDLVTARQSGHRASGRGTRFPAALAPAHPA